MKNDTFDIASKHIALFIEADSLARETFRLENELENANCVSEAEYINMSIRYAFARIHLEEMLDRFISMKIDTEYCEHVKASRR